MERGSWGGHPQQWGVRGHHSPQVLVSPSFSHQLTLTAALRRRAVSYPHPQTVARCLAVTYSYKFNVGTRVVHLQCLAARHHAGQAVITQLPQLHRLLGVNTRPQHALAQLRMLTQKQSLVLLHC